MDDGIADTAIVAELMQDAIGFVAKAELAGKAGDQHSRLAMILQALNVTNAALAAIECWRIQMLEEREKITGEPVFEIEAVVPPPRSRH